MMKLRSGIPIPLFTIQQRNPNKNPFKKQNNQLISCISPPFSVSLYILIRKNMTFDKITKDGRLWAVRFDENTDNEFIRTID